MGEKQRKTGERSSFAVTCSLLSQYLKEKRSFGRIHRPQEKPKDLILPQTTMNLFPISEISAENQNESDSSEVLEGNAMMSVHPSSKKEKEVNAQLTIFYDGKVIVFDNFPPEKSKDLMEMASKGKSFPSQSKNVGSFDLVSVPVLSSESNVYELAMPIARRASLLRFLEKRKDRIISKAPYSVNGSWELKTGRHSQVREESNKARIGL